MNSFATGKRAKQHIQIQTERLQLRPFQKSDLDRLHQIWTEPGVRKFLWDDLIISRDTGAAVIEQSLMDFESRKFGFWCLFLKDSDVLIGFAGLREFGVEHEVELLYGLLPKFRHQGYATEASRAVLQHGFQICGLTKIYAGADTPNEASFRVMRNLGMIFAKRMIVKGKEAMYYCSLAPSRP